MLRIHQAIPAIDAAQRAPALGSLLERAQASQAHLKAVLHLVPPALRATIKAGPLVEHEWCLLVPNAAASAKLRQLTPLMVALLNRKGVPIHRIRLKVMQVNTW